MLPSSDEIEAFFGRVKRLHVEISKIRTAQVQTENSKQELAAVAREWLRTSQALRSGQVCDVTRLDTHDRLMKGLLEGASARPTVAAVKKKLATILQSSFDDVVVPLIQYEGSPRQVAARQIQSAFGASLSPDEVAYVEEAARCVTVQAFRAALIMLWAAGISRLHDAVINRGFDAYNAAVDLIAKRKGQPFSRINVGSKIGSLPELQKAKDADIILVGMDLFGYDMQVFQELDRLLGTRNDAAHPGMGRPGALDVQQFASKINDYVFAKVA